METLEITVTQNDIDKSIPGCPMNCMVANGIHNSLGLNVKSNLHDLNVSCKSALLDLQGDKTLELIFPESIVKKIEAFDKTGSASPFGFTARVKEICSDCYSSIVDGVCSNCGCY